MPLTIEEGFVAIVTPAKSQRGRVLAVDDDEAILAMLARVLGAEGFVVEGVPSAAAALVTPSTANPSEPRTRTSMARIASSSSTARTRPRGVLPEAA